MLPRILMIILFVVPAWPAHSLAQVNANATLRLKRCGDPSEPIGFLAPGKGVVSFRVREDGAVDTASIGTVQHGQLSSAGLRSVAVRVLAHCRVSLPKNVDRVAGRAVADLEFKFTKVEVKAVHWSDAPPPLIALERFDLPSTALPLRSDSRIAEEHASPLACSFSSGRGSQLKIPPPAPRDSVAPRLGTQEAAEAEKASAARRAEVAKSLPSREATFLEGELLVRSDGHADPGFKVTNLPSDHSGTSIARRAVSCPYAPARYYGVAVDSWIAIMLDGRGIRVVVGRAP